jgi:hypothetical protein
MTYRTVGPALVGHQPIATTDTVQNHPLGTIIQAHDPIYGAGEFIYLKGVASTVVGSIVNFKGTTYQTALGYAGENVPGPLAVAMSANVASQYGWYQISGLAVAAKACTVSFAAAAKVAVGSSSGLAVASLSGQEIQGAMVSAVASATAGRTTVTLVMNRPALQGRVT